MNKKIKDIIAKKDKSKIVSLTAYSKNIAQIIDKYVDMTLVGDSMASVLYNYNTTRKISLDSMIEHAKSVRMGVHNSLMVFDMPYNTYKDKKNALLNAKKIIKKTKSDAVKLEGGSKIKDIVKYLIKNKIPVLGHLGIMPQSVRGKFKSKGKTERERTKILKDAKVLEKLGVFAIVLECIEKSLAKKITNEVKVPTIGIGSSVYCDGQILVTDDLIGLTNSKIKFVKKYINISSNIATAVKKFKQEVKLKKYPTKKYSY
jgi:3-methyl-2-oxobutanoate hydroxymethyltransferase